MLKLNLQTNLKNIDPYRASLYRTYRFKDSEFIPICNIPFIKASSSYKLHSTSSSSNMFIKLFNISSKTHLHRVIVDSYKVHTNKEGYYKFLQSSKILLYNTICKSIERYYSEYIPFRNHQGFRSGYEEVFRCFLTSGISKHHSTRLYSLSTLHGILTCSISKRVLCTVVIDKKYINYYKMCMYLDETPLPEIFEVFVEKSMTVEGSAYDKLYKKLKTAILNKLKKQGFKITIVDNLTDFLSQRKEYPKFKNVRERLNYPNVITEEVKEHLISNALLLDRDLELIG